MSDEIKAASVTRKIPDDVQAALDRIIRRYNLQQGVYKDLTEIAAEMVVEAEQRSAQFMASYRASTDADAMIARTSPRDAEIERLRAEVGKLRVQRAGEDVRLADAISERDRLRAEVANIAYERDGLLPQIDGLRAELEQRTAYVVTHRGAALSCSDSMRKAYSDEKVRADRAETALAALRKRVEEAPVVEWSREDWIDHCDSVSPSYIGERVALVVLGEG